MLITYIIIVIVTNCSLMICRLSAVSCFALMWSITLICRKFLTLFMNV